MFLLIVILYLYQAGIQAAPLDLTVQNPALGLPPQSLPVCKDTRSLSDIVWSCLATSFACSWVSVHPNMPGPGEGRVTKGLRRLELMFWSIITPELIIMWAIRQWYGARRLEKKYRDRGWTKTHGYFMQMGGFRLYDGEISMGVLSAERFESLLRKGKINMPAITEEDIQDRSKGDGLSKALVIFQTSWFIIQSAARLASRLVLTQIELITLALAVLNSIMYFFWWNKPLDVQSTFRIYLLESSIDQISMDDLEIENHGTPLFDPCPPGEIDLWEVLCKFCSRWPMAGVIMTLNRMEEMTQLRSDPVVDGLERVPTFYAAPIPFSGCYDKVNVNIVALSSIIGTLFGVVHCTGWLFSFPTEGEATTWRVLSIIVSGAPLTGIWSLLPHFAYRTSRLGDIFLTNLMIFLFIPPYLLARIGLLVVAVISLRDLPDGAYDVVTWTTFLPHV